jgi:hypothetical protein
LADGLERFLSRDGCAGQFLASVVSKDATSIVEIKLESCHCLLRSCFDGWSSSPASMNSCVYRKLKHGRSGGEVRPGWHVTDHTGSLNRATNRRILSKIDAF